MGDMTLEEELKALLKAADESGVDVLGPYLERPLVATRQAFTKLPDWVGLNGRITNTAFRLWCILRSMQFENGPGIPPLTLDQVCWLLPGVKGKPTSRARAREALDCLLNEGLLNDVSAPGLSKSAPRLYLAMDEPQRPARWMNARSKLREYRKLWRKGS